jgi:hypothetical protein
LTIFGTCGAKNITKYACSLASVAGTCLFANRKKAFHLTVSVFAVYRKERVLIGSNLALVLL